MAEGMGQTKVEKLDKIRWKHLSFLKKITLTF